MDPIHEIKTDFRLLFQRPDIYDDRDPRRSVWMLVERDQSGIAIHIFLEKPPIATEPAGALLRIWHWGSGLIPTFCRRKPSLRLPYVPYELAIVGVQVHLHDNKIESIVWNPVPGEDDFREDPDLPENPTVEVLIEKVDAHR